MRESMRRLARAFGHYGIWTVLLLSMVYFLTNALALYRINRDNGLIRALNSGRDVEITRVMAAAPRVRLARAGYLAAKNRNDEALAALANIIDRGNAGMQRMTRYNLGNIYLRQALKEVEKMNIEEAVTLASLAKQAYRQALAIDSHYWDAKYNLEVAMRLMPEMDRIDIDERAETKKPGKPWTTIPGFPRGLP